MLVAVHDRVSLARDAALGDDERDQPLFGPGVAGSGDRLGPDEARVLLAAPAEAGLDRVSIGVHVVAVEVKADLEAKRVARSEAGGGGAAVDERLPDAWRGVGAEQQLDAVLAGVAR